MGEDVWHADSAARLVAILGQQHRRIDEKTAKQRRESQSRERNRNARNLTAIVFLVASGVVVFWPPPLHIGLFALLLFATPLLAGAAGGVTRTLPDVTPSESEQPQPIFPSVAPGMAAGVIAALLFLVAQFTTNPSIRNLGDSPPQDLRWLGVFGLIVGFVAGLTLEVVFGKLRRANVTNLQTLESFVQSRPGAERGI